MKKSLLLFSLLLLAIFVWKVTEATEEDQWETITVEELVSESAGDKVAGN